MHSFNNDTSPRLVFGFFVGALLTIASVRASDASRTVPENKGSVAINSRTKKASVTFAEDIAPIIFQNCASCHRPGEAAPFSLLNYSDVKNRAKQIAEVTRKKFMPPWHAEPGYGEFVGHRFLTPEQIASIQTWLSQGAPEGDPAKLVALPKFTEGWQLGKPDLVVKMSEAFPVQADGRDVYRNFVVPLNLSEDKYLKAVEFRPSARTVVHHCLFFLDATGVARQLDEADPGPGFGGMGGRSREFTGIGGWAVGSNPRHLPEGLAWRMPKGSDLILQTHFHPSGKEENEQSVIGLYFADRVPEKKFADVQLPPKFGALAGIDIPAGEANYTIADSFILPVDIEAFAVSGHAHYLGKEMKLKAVLPDGTEQGLLWIKDWEFNWQEQYSYKEYVRLAKGTRIEATIIYDNSEMNLRNPSRPPKRVKWGRMSFDEMGSITLQVVASREDEFPQLQAAIREHVRIAALTKAMANGTNQIRRGALLRRIQELSKKGSEKNLKEGADNTVPEPAR